MTGGAPCREAIAGLVLAGGRGTRMGGADKGLLPWARGTLAGHAAARLGAQVARVALSANRHVDAYARLGVPVLADAVGDDGRVPFDGPLAGLLAALDAPLLRDFDWIALVPCDVPRFPPDLVARLAAAAGAAGAPAAHAVSRDPRTGAPQEQPLCAMVARSVRDAVAAHLASGRRSARGVLAAAGAVAVPFDRPGDDPLAFANANDPDDLLALDPLRGPTK